MPFKTIWSAKIQFNLHWATSHTSLYPLVILSSVPHTVSFVRSSPKAKRKLTSTHRKYCSWPKNFVCVFSIRCYGKTWTNFFRQPDIFRSFVRQLYLKSVTRTNQREKPVVTGLRLSSWIFHLILCSKETAESKKHRPFWNACCTSILVF